MTNPTCKDCPDLHPICHDSCPKYAEYKRPLECISKNAFNQEFWMGGRKR